MPDYAPDPVLPSDHMARYADLPEPGVVEVRPSPSGLTAREAAVACAGCGHAAIDHEVNVGDWPCQTDGCSCLGFNVVADGGAPVDDGPATKPLAERPLDLRAAFKSRPQVEQRELVRSLGLDSYVDDRFDDDEMGDVFLRRVGDSGNTERLALLLEPPAETIALPPLRPDWEDAIDAGVAAAAAAADQGATPDEMVAATAAAMAPPADGGRPDPDALPVSRRTPPPMPPPPQPKRPDGLAIRFARQVLDDPPPVGEWVRLDQPVKRSIVTAKARQFAQAFNLRFHIRVDHVDLTDPQSEMLPHLFVQVLPDPDALDA